MTVRLCLRRADVERNRLHILCIGCRGSVVESWSLKKARTDDNDEFTMVHCFVYKWTLWTVVAFWHLKKKKKKKI